MTIELNQRIKELKILLNNREANVIDAFETLDKILDDYLDETEDSDIDFEAMKNINGKFYEKNLKVKQRLRLLHKTILLQELGIVFKKEELEAILSR